jgi:hypothetical protein
VRVLFTPNDNEIVEEIERSIDLAGGKVLPVSLCRALASIQIALGMGPLDLARSAGTADDILNLTLEDDVINLRSQIHRGKGLYWHRCMDTRT